MVKPLTKPALVELTSCGKGRGWTITKKLQEISNTGPAAASRYTGDTDSGKKKPAAKKPTFPSREEQEARKRFDERKDKVINQKEESIGECYTSLR